MAIYRLEFTDKGEPLFIEDEDNSASDTDQRDDDSSEYAPMQSTAPQPPRPAA